jgi:hypothetical protein
MFLFRDQKLILLCTALMNGLMPIRSLNFVPVYFVKFKVEFYVNCGKLLNPPNNTVTGLP